MLTSGAYGYLLDYLVWWTIIGSLLLHTWFFFRLFPLSRAKARLIFGNALVFLCLLGLLAIIAETYFRFIAIQTDSFGMSLPARRWFALHTKLNSLGCRDKEWSRQKTAGTHRIAFMGDSFTYGWGIENPENRFSDLVQARFDAAKATAVEVMNVAKPGWGTGDEIQPLIDMIEVFEVDEVILCHVPNDIEKLLPRTNEFDPIRPPAPVFFNLESSPLLDFLYRRIYLPRVPTVYHYHDWLADGYADSVIWKRQCAYFDRIVEQCRQHRVTIRVALLPFLRTQGVKFDQTRVHQQIRAYFETQHVPIVDLLPAIKAQAVEKLVVNSMDSHPNELAHLLFAKAIMQAYWPDLTIQSH